MKKPVLLYISAKMNFNWKMCSGKIYYDRRKAWKNVCKLYTYWLAQGLLSAVDFTILIWIGNILNRFHPSCRRIFKCCCERKKKPNCHWAIAHKSLEYEIVPTNRLLICIRFALHTLHLYTDFVKICSLYFSALMNLQPLRSGC